MSNLIDQGKSITHEKFTGKIESVLVDGNVSKSKLKVPSDIPLEYADWCYPPVVQSGGKFDLKPSAVSNSDKLHEGIIVCSLGIRFKSYCSNVARTYLMNPTPQQESNYGFLLELQAFAASQIVVGNTCAGVYESVLAHVVEKRPDLKESLLKNFGFGMGIEFREPLFLLSPKSSKMIESGMVFNLSIGFHNLEQEAKSSKDRVYSLFLADTIVVTPTGSVFLTDAEKDLKNVSYSFGDDEEEEADENVIMQVDGRVKQTRSGGDTTRNEADKGLVEKRQVHQRKLATTKQEEGLARYSTGKDGEDLKTLKPVIRKFESYRKETNLPKQVSDLTIFIDRRSETVILPIYGQPVPFHLSTIKNVSKSDETEFALLRINFVSPGQTLNKKEGPMPYEDPNATFIKSMSYRSMEHNRMTEIAREINDLKKDLAKREAERVEMAGIVEQAELMEVKGKRPVRLPDVYVRPGLEGKRFPGDLEIHLNGLRYMSQLKGDQKVDILFSNIAHLFFQPCDGEMIVLLHIHLKNAVMIGKKKTKDVQFYREVSDANFDETGNRRRRVHYGDEDELAQEQEERRRRAFLNKEFQSFSEKIHEGSKNKVEVDIPFRDLGFQGVPFRQLVTMQPTTECLVHLSDMPFFVVNLTEVEVAHMERVQFGLKNFDLVFVFKDFSRAPAHINTIPMTHLEHVKEWLDSMDISFTEGPVNLSWPQIMKTINDDPKAFFEEAGGWSFLQPESSEDGSQMSEESAFEAESEEEEESSESDFGSSGGSEDDDEDGSDESAVEEGEDWDEMERKAAEHDQRKRDREDDDPPRKKNRH